jgi:hypothetical protein
MYRQGHVQVYSFIEINTLYSTVFRVPTYCLYIQYFAPLMRAGKYSTVLQYVKLKKSPFFNI